MANWLTCDVCGHEKTGIGSLLFCPKEDNHEAIEMAKNKQFIAFGMKLEGTECCLAASAHVYSTLSKAARACALFISQSGIVKIWYIYSIVSKMPEGWMEETPNAATLGTNKVELIGVEVEFEGEVS